MRALLNAALSNTHMHTVTKANNAQLSGVSTFAPDLCSKSMAAGVPQSYAAEHSLPCA